MIRVKGAETTIVGEQELQVLPRAGDLVKVFHSPQGRKRALVLHGTCIGCDHLIFADAHEIHCFVRPVGVEPSEAEDSAEVRRPEDREGDPQP